ncbi:copia protein [Tanacetum coccineum]
MDSGGGGGKKKKKNNSNDSPINTVMESADGDELNEVLGISLATSAPKVTTSAGNAPGKYSFANVTSKLSGKKLNIRKQVAYPVVANYVRNTWGKYGLARSMFSSSTCLFSFQFSTIEGLEAMLENSLWFIRNNPLLLKKWHPNENLLKEDVSTVSV